MILENHTPFVAGWTMGFERDGRELVVVAVKGTFTIPTDDREPEPAVEQLPLIEADQFTGEPGLSAPLRESDYAHRKPLCDVLVVGRAYAPPGRRALQLPVGLRVGALTKAFRVVGDRTWRRGVFGVRPSDPEPFAVMQVSYDNAFGGVDDSSSDSAKVVTFLENPVGRGFWRSKDKADGMPLPNTEELDRPITDPSGAYRPMSLSGIGRNWQPRVRHAGTYDQQWMDTTAPFWPADFDYRYFQAAPPDQQMPYPTGGEDVILKNLTPDGHLQFRLPRRPMPVWFLPYQGQDSRIDAALDTIVIEPDASRFSVVWRATLPMRQSCFDIKQIIAGEMPAAWQRARKYGKKPYFRGLAELVRARRRGELR